MNWTSVRLDELAQIVGGATPSTTVSDYWDGDILWATPADLSELNSRFISDTARKISAAGLRSCAAEILPPDSVLLSSRAPIGHVAINLAPMATNQGFKSIIPDASRLHSGFVYWWLKSNKDYLQSLGNGATFKEISKAVVSKIQIPVPPLDEQRRIAAILDKADDLRRKRRVAIEKLSELSQSIFYDMFGDPIKNTKGLPISLVGDLVASMVYGPRFYNEAYSENGVRIVRITDLTRDGELDFESMPRLDVSASDQARYLLSPGDILFARTGATVGKIALIRNGDPPCIAGAYFVKLVFGSLINPTYARFSLTSEATQAIIKAGSRQAAQQNFSGPGIRRLNMLVPPLDSQVDFANKVEMIEKSKALCLEQLRKCNVLFSSLQKYAFF